MRFPYLRADTLENLVPILALLFSDMLSYQIYPVPVGITLSNLAERYLESTDFMRILKARMIISGPIFASPSMQMEGIVLFAPSGVCRDEALWLGEGFFYSATVYFSEDVPDVILVRQGYH